MRNGSIGLVPWVLFVAIGCEKAAEPRPDSPNHDDVVAGYGPQSGALTSAAASALVVRLSEQLSEIEALFGLFGLIDSVRNGLGTQGGVVETGTGALTVSRPAFAIRRQALAAEAGGWARVTHRCELGGELVFFALFGDDGVEDVLWGEVDRCSLGGQETSERSQFTGDLWVKTGVRSTETSEANSTIFLFDGDIDGQTQLSFDVQISPTHLFIREEVEAGTFLVGVAFDDSETVIVRDRDGDWQCGASACTGPDDAQVDL